MSRLTAFTIAAILVAGLAVTGCNDQTKKELTALKHQYNDLQLDKAEVQKALEKSRKENNDLMNLLDSKDNELNTARAEIAELKNVKPEKRPPVPPGWQETATGAKVTLASDILFSAGRASLSKQGKTRLRQIAATIKVTYPDSIVRVYGFTDSDPIKKSKKLWADNLDLSSNRAMAVVRLLRSLGIESGKLEAIGMGATHFVAPNTTTAGKTRNRRVEIVVVK